MKRPAAIGLCALTAGLAATIAVAQQKAAPKAVVRKTATPTISPISVDPINPHYLRFHGRAAVFVSSSEHYGAAMNAGFDYMKYLDALRDEGLNFTRVFNGSYVEPLDTAMYAGAEQNTLSPGFGFYLAPWARSGAPGYAGGGRKFDLKQWDEDYFSRLKSLAAEASRRSIAVEVTLFSAMYGTGKSNWGSWNVNPLNAENNINGVGEITWDRFNTLDNAGLVAAQDAVVRKTVTELNGLDNVFYEVCNEPWFSGAGAKQTRDWVNHVIATIQMAEAALPNKHLIAENAAEGYATIRDPNPAVSLYNFHRLTTPAALALNWALRKPIAIDQTSDGCAVLDRRREAWSFMLSGGAGYNNLDASFTTADPTGKATPSNCEGVRYELQTLGKFMSGLDFEHMQPDRENVRQFSRYASEIYMLDDPGRVYAMYLKGGNDSRTTTILLEAPAGRYQAEWLNPRTGETSLDAVADHPGGVMKIQTPEFSEDLALKLVRTGDLPVTKAPPKAVTPSKRPAAKKN
jgi:hypothetical protein